MTNRDRAKVVPYQNRHSQSFPPVLGAPHSLWSLKLQPSLNAALAIIRLKISQQAWQRETRQRGIGKFLLVLLFAVSWSHGLSLIWATLWQRWLMEFLCTGIGSHGWFKGIITLYGIASPDHWNNTKRSGATLAVHLKKVAGKARSCHRDHRRAIPETTLPWLFAWKTNDKRLVWTIAQVFLGNSHTYRWRVACMEYEANV